MVQSITAGINNNPLPDKSDIRKLYKYVNNQSIKAEVPDTFVSSTKSAAGSAAFFEGIPLIGFLFKNKKLNKLPLDKMKTLDASTRAAFKNIKNGSGKLTERIANYIETAQANKEAYRTVRSQAKQAAKLAKSGVEAKEALELVESGANVKAIKNAIKKGASVETVVAEAKTALGEANAAAVKEAGKAAETAAKAGGKFGKVGSFIKSSGAGIMLVFSGVIEMATEVIPTFKELGKEKGLKQLGKSFVKVLGDTTGFIAGEQIGTAIGSAIGTAILPGFGTAIGAVVGMIGGMTGSFIAGKITKKITGPSERELVKQNAENEAINKYMSDSLAQYDLKAAAKAKINEELNTTGELKGDSSEIYSLLYGTAANPFVTA